MTPLMQMQSAPPPGMPALLAQVYVRNLSTVVTDAVVQSWIAPLQAQISEDFAPFYRDADISWLDKTAPIPAGGLPLNIFDNSDQAGALGYHLADTGWPEGRVFAKSVIENGASPLVTASHENMEMLADPFCSLVQLIDGQMGGIRGGTVAAIAYEVADGPEDDQFAYVKQGQKVSDFVLPWWFGGAVPAGYVGRYSFTGATKEAFSIDSNGQVHGLLSGGYIGIRQFKRAGNWGTVQARLDAFSRLMDSLLPPDSAHILKADGTAMPASEIEPGSRRWVRQRNMTAV